MPEIRRVKTGASFSKNPQAKKPAGKEPEAPPPVAPTKATKARTSAVAAKARTSAVASTAAAPTDTKALAKAASAIPLPAFLERATLPELVSAELNGYAGFADSNSKNWVQMQGVGLATGDPFIVKDGQYIKCKPLEYFLLCGESFRSTMVGKEGAFKFVTRDLEVPLKEIASQYPTEGLTGPALEAAKEKISHILKAEPHYVCLLLVKVGDQLVPIKADFRGTKSGAAESAVRAVESAATPEWMKLSEAHKVTGAFQHPFGRVWNSVTTQHKVGRSSGNSFYVARCNSTPATVAQMQILVDAFGDEAFVQELEDAEKNYQQRIEYLDKLALES